MTQLLGTIRQYKTRNFTVIVDAIEEDFPDLSWDETGEVLAKLDSGEYILFTARARVLFHGQELASDYLGNCVYESLAAFKGPDYFADMVHSVCRDARQCVVDMQDGKLPIQQVAIRIPR